MTSKIPVLFSGAKHGWWDNNGAIGGALAAYKAKGAASLAESYVNLANPGTYDAAIVSAPTLVANGWMFNGSTQALKYIGPFTNSSSMIIQFSNVTNNNYICGNFSGFSIQPNRTGGIRRYHGLSNVDKSGSVTNGNMCMSGARYGYLNGVYDSADTGAFPTFSSSVLFIGAMTNDGVTVFSACACIVQAFAVYSAALSATEVAAISSGMTAL